MEQLPIQTTSTPYAMMEYDVICCDENYADVANRYAQAGWRIVNWMPVRFVTGRQIGVAYLIERRKTYDGVPVACDENLDGFKRRPGRPKGS